MIEAVIFENAEQVRMMCEGRGPSGECRSENSQEGSDKIRKS